MTRLRSGCPRDAGDSSDSASLDVLSAAPTPKGPRGLECQHLGDPPFIKIAAHKNLRLLQSRRIQHLPYGPAERDDIAAVQPRRAGPQPGGGDPPRCGHRIVRIEEEDGAIAKRFDVALEGGGLI